MQVQLDRETEALIQRKVETGRYRTADEVVREAVQLLEEEDDHVQRLRAAIAEGEEGEDIPWTPELMDRLTREAEEMARRGERPHADVCP